MSYYLIEISKGDFAITGKGIYTYDKPNDAIAAFHSKIGAAMKSDMYTSEMVKVIDEDGNSLCTEHYVPDREV